MKTKLGAPKQPLLCTCLFLLVGLFSISFASGTLGQIGPDSDDLMRLLQVRDFMAGQAWFDPYQYRLGLDGGTNMHWSRLPDIPLILLIGLFDLFVSYDMAEKIAITIWPPLTALGVVFGLFLALKNVEGKYTKIFGLILMAFIFIKFYRFAPGAIDHHNLQLLLLAVALGFAIDTQERFRSYAAVGVACAMSIAVGMEVYVFVGVFCAYFAINWLLKGAAVSKATGGFGAAFGLGLLLMFGIMIGPENYGTVYCDAFSLISLLAGCLGGFGLAAAALIFGQRSLLWRLGALVALGLACSALFLTQAPQCLSNPLSDLPPIVHTLWLDEVSEAQNMFGLWKESKQDAAYTLGIQITSLIVTAWLLFKEEDKRIFGLIFALVLVSFLFSLYQARFYAFGFLFAIVPLARWIGLCFEKKAKTEGSVAYILALAVSLPYVFAFPFLITNKTVETTGEADLPAQCFSDEVFDALNALPSGALLANSNAGPEIIDRTKHRAINGNYHRNVEGIKASIEIFTSPPGTAEAFLKQHKIDYMHFCRTTRETTINQDHAPNGLVGNLLDGNTPEFLTPIGPDLENGAVTIYKIN